MSEQRTIPASASGVNTTGDQRPSPAAPTPGPWSVRDNTPELEALGERSSGWVDVTTVAHDDELDVDYDCHIGSAYGRDYQTNLANAKMFSAALDMLVALRLARTHVSPAVQPEIYAVMDAAIAKATGTTP